MPEYSLSFDGTQWRENEELVDWQCSQCGARFEREDEAEEHLRIQHGNGTIHPRINTLGRGRLMRLGQALRMEDELAKLDELTILDMLGFKSRVIKGEEAKTEQVSSTPPRGDWDAIFDWYYRRQEETGQRMTVKDLASKIGYSYGWTRQCKSDYDDEHKTHKERETPNRETYKN